MGNERNGKEKGVDRGSMREWGKWKMEGSWRGLMREWEIRGMEKRKELTGVDEGMGMRRMEKRGS